MGPTSFTISGPRQPLEQLCSELSAKVQAGEITITEPTAAGRLRQPWELAEAVWTVLLTVPASMLAQATYEWVRDWLKSRAAIAKLQIQEVPSAKVTPVSVPNEESSKPQRQGPA